MPEIINTEDAPAAIGPYSQAVKAGKTLFISGQLPINPKTGQIESVGIVDQTHQSLNNLKAIITKAGLDLNNVVKVGVFISDMNDFSTINEVYEKFFENIYPARFVVEVSRLPKDALIEIDAIVVDE